MNKGMLYIVAAPSGAGKTSLLKELLKKNQNLSLSVSHTTRSPRPGEVDGVDYHFLSVEVFKEKIEAGEFIEFAQVFDNYYGTSEKAIYTQLERGSDVIVEIDWQGARQVRERISENCSIFIIPPSHQALEDRLKSRGQDSDEIIQRRMQDAQNEMAHYAEFDYLIINDDFSQASSDLQAVFSCQRLTLSRQRTLIPKLIEDLLESSSD